MFFHGYVDGKRGGEFPIWRTPNQKARVTSNIKLEYAGLIILSIYVLIKTKITFLGNYGTGIYMDMSTLTRIYV
jgi:hypothetical protein